MGGSNYQPNMTQHYLELCHLESAERYQNKPPVAVHNIHHHSEQETTSISENIAGVRWSPILVHILHVNSYMYIYIYVLVICACVCVCVLV